MHVDRSSKGTYLTPGYNLEAYIPTFGKVFFKTFLSLISASSLIKIAVSESIKQFI